MCLGVNCDFEVVLGVRRGTSEDLEVPFSLFSTKRAKGRVPRFLTVLLVPQRKEASLYNFTGALSNTNNHEYKSSSRTYTR